MKPYSRRHFLRSSTAIIGLPLLPSLGHAAQPMRCLNTDSTSVAPKRVVFLGMGWGVTKESWYPDQTQTGVQYKLPEGLRPLAKHKEDFSIIQNLRHQYSDQAHWGSTFWLTGANRFAIPGQNFHNSVSVDQLVAADFGRQTRFTSLQLGCEKADGHGPGLSLAWSEAGKPVSGLDNPVIAFHKLFSENQTPIAQRKRMIKDRRSILDAVAGEAKSVSSKLNSSDTAKMDEYLQSIRDIEVRLAKEEQWLTVAKRQPDSPVELPEGDIAGVEEVKCMYDLIVASMQVDSSRVFTYRLPNDTFIQSLGATISAHNMSHYNRGPRQAVSEMRDQKNAELLGYFFDRLKATKDIDGTTLFDNTAIAFGSNISTIHNLTNCPTLIAGGGAGFKQGQHIVLDDPKTPLCNLWLSMLQGVGIKADSFGDSTGVIDALKI